jgi:acyl-coenzyme A synthetase/AMP-(fatty) acid ligase
MQTANSAGLKAPPYFNFATSVFDTWAAETPNSLALWYVNPTSGAEQKLTFHQMSARSRQAANFLSASGVMPGDRVLLMLPRIPEWWIAMLALIRLGAIPVPATLLLTPRDVAFRLETARVSAVITNEEGLDKVQGFKGTCFLIGPRHAGWLDFDSGTKSASARFKHPRTRSTDPGILYFTSATTGDPKMVLHTQASYGLAHRLTGELWLDLRAGDVHWNISDLGWGKAAWSSFFGPWHMGACVFALDHRSKFDPVLTLDTLAKYPITTWCAPPTALRLLVRQDLSRWNFQYLRHCVTAGEPLNPEVLQLWRTGTGLTLYEGYGQTESVVLVGNLKRLAHEVSPGSMGHAVPGMNVTLVDEELREAPDGVEGEVAIRVNPTRPLGLFKEYWHNPEETAHKFQGDFYLTGDRATRTSDGAFWFIGRKDDVIKSSGYRIGPFEVESALLEHRAVLDVAVIGKPDPLRGQLVKAYVVLRSGFTAEDSLRSELQTHCKSLIAAYKYPREIEFVSELPKTTSGKTRHVALRQQLTVSPG